jgi:hypothetical protein
MAEKFTGTYFREADDEHTLHLGDVLAEQGWGGQEGAPVDWMDMYLHQAEVRTLKEGDIRQLGSVVITRPEEVGRQLPQAA